jgi:hypothetical protein
MDCSSGKCTGKTMSLDGVPTIRESKIFLAVYDIAPFHGLSSQSWDLPNGKSRLFLLEKGYFR